MGVREVEHGGRHACALRLTRHARRATAGGGAGLPHAMREAARDRYAESRWRIARRDEARQPWRVEVSPASWYAIDGTSASREAPRDGRDKRRAIDGTRAALRACLARCAPSGPDTPPRRRRPCPPPAGAVGEFPCGGGVSVRRRGRPNRAPPASPPPHQGRACSSRPCTRPAWPRPAVVRVGPRRRRRATAGAALAPSDPAGDSEGDLNKKKQCDQL